MESARLRFTGAGSGEVLVSLLGGRQQAALRVCDELREPSALPARHAGIEAAAREIVVWRDATATVAVEWRENDFQEKVSLYYHAYLHVRASGDSVTAWIADHTGTTHNRSEIDVWVARAGWRAARARLAAALAPHGVRDDSDRCVLPLVMQDGDGRDAFLAAYAGRRDLGDGWIGATFLNDDAHFPEERATAWREQDGRFVIGSWIRDRWAFADAVLADAVLADAALRRHFAR